MKLKNYNKVILYVTIVILIVVLFFINMSFKDYKDATDRKINTLEERVSRVEASVQEVETDVFYNEENIKRAFQNFENLVDQDLIPNNP